MNILSYNPGHDGAIAYIQDGKLIASIEAEKDSGYRHSPLSAQDMLNFFGEYSHLPDVLCRGGWWPSDMHLSDREQLAGYCGTSSEGNICGKVRFRAENIEYFSSSHERSHILCAFGMSDLPKGTPCYALLWEGVIGSFYKVDSKLNVTKLQDVLPEPGHRYALLYGMADPQFDMNSAEFSRFSDAGKLMALASFSKRGTPTEEEEEVIAFLMQHCSHLKPKDCDRLRKSRYYNVGVEDQEFRNFAGIFSDRLFERFFQFAEQNLKRNMPLLITGGCGLNCDWNSKWKESGLFSEIFVPPVANDSGSAIGTAIDAQFHFTGNPKIEWSVYSGQEFKSVGFFDESLYSKFDLSCATVADMLACDLILGWVHGKYEIGPRALGNRSILASPFHSRMTVRLNEIKQREQFRPIAPVCLEEDAVSYFGSTQPSPFMLYTQQVRSDALAAVTHVNGTARIQTVSSATNEQLFKLLEAFKARTGFGVLCNTSLNFKGRGFINNITDLSNYTVEHHLDGFVVGSQCYMLRNSENYQEYLRGKIFSTDR